MSDKYRTIKIKTSTYERLKLLAGITRKPIIKIIDQSVEDQLKKQGKYKRRK